jgi:hypothetical protein
MLEYFVAYLHGDEEELHDHREDQAPEENIHEQFHHVHVVEQEPPLDSIEDQMHEDLMKNLKINYLKTPLNTKILNKTLLVK